MKGSECNDPLGYGPLPNEVVEPQPVVFVDLGRFPSEGRLATFDYQAGFVTLDGPIANDLLKKVEAWQDQILRSIGITEAMLGKLPARPLRGP